MKLFSGDEDIVAKVLMAGATSAASSSEDSASVVSTLSYVMKPLQKGVRKEAVCSHMESPGKLWCQFLEDEETLHELMDRLREVYNALGAEELLCRNLDVGSICCGQFTIDDEWYRAEVLALQDEGLSYNNNIYFAISPHFFTLT